MEEVLKRINSAATGQMGNRGIARICGVTFLLDGKRYRVFENFRSRTTSVRDLVHHGRMGIKPFRIGAAMNEVLELIEKVEAGGCWNPSLWTGLRELDEHVGGFVPGELWVIGGRSSMGKSALMWHFLERICVNGGAPAMVVTGERIFSETLWRRVFSRAGLKIPGTAPGWVPGKPEIEAIRSAAQALKEARLFVNDRGAVGLNELYWHLRSSKGKGRIELLVVDDFTLLKGEKISANLKELARKLKVAVLALCGLERETDGRKRGIPHLEDLGNCGSLVEDADKVLLLHFPAHDEEDEGERRRLAGEARIYVRKNEEGECGSLLLKFDGALRKFSDWDCPSWDGNSW